MAKNFPFFKFVVTEWMTGDIVYEDFAVQGLFINICALYWQRDGVLSIEDINKRYKKPAELPELTERFLSVKDGFITIKFLDEQLVEANHISKVNSANGALGGRPKITDRLPVALPTESESKPKKSKEEQEEEEEEEEEEEKKKKIQAQAPTHTQELKDKFAAFCEWLTSNAPRVKKMKEPFTIEQYERILKDFPNHTAIIRDVLMSMHNKPALTKDYASANLTLRNWIKSRIEKQPPVIPITEDRETIKKHAAALASRYD